jgi:Kef-type K+ transport system membrane component KefB
MTNLELFIHVACAMAVIIFMARLVGSMMVYINQPRVVGEMIAGVLLGPTLFSTILPEVTTYLFADTKPIIYFVGNLGLSFYMFMVGMDIDFSKVDKSIRKQATILSTVATIIPFLMGCLAAYMFYDQLALPNISFLVFAIFLGTALSIMAFPMLARILDEKKLIQTKLGSLALLSASGQDVVTWILLAFISSLAATGLFTKGFFTLGGAIVFIFIIFLVAKPLLSILVKDIQKKGELNQTHFAIIIISVLLAAIITDKIGLYSVFGGFIFGLAIPREKILIDTLKNKIQDIVVVMLLPLFFAFSGLKTNFLQIFTASMIVPTIVIVLFAFACKYIPVLFTMKFSGYSWRESSATAGLMNARGLMELIVASIGLEYNIIDANTFSILVLIAVTTTLAAMPIYNWSMKGLKNMC